MSYDGSIDNMLKSDLSSKSKARQSFMYLGKQITMNDFPSRRSMVRNSLHTSVRREMDKSFINLNARGG